MNPTTIAISHPSSLSAGDIASITSTVLSADAPVVVASIPGLSAGTQTTVLGYAGLANMGLQIFAQIVAAIHAAHIAKTT